MNVTTAPDRPLRVAIAQMQPTAGDLGANIAAVAEAVRRAGELGAAVVLTPEKVLSGYEPDLIGIDPARYAVTAADPRLKPIAEACVAAGVTAVVGAATRVDGALRISVLVLNGTGAEAARYDKRHLFESEQFRFVAGKSDLLLDVDGWRLGLGICFDSGFPEHARGLVDRGAHAYLVGALFSRGNGEREIAEWFPVRARDNGIYTVLANHVGVTGGWDTCGQSAVWGPDGGLRAVAGPDDPELLIVDLDPRALPVTRDPVPQSSVPRSSAVSPGR
jgi:5-aminopentanamidase